MIYSIDAIYLKAHYPNFIVPGHEDSCVCKDFDGDPASVG
jgi:hypothetical protein